MGRGGARYGAGRPGHRVQAGQVLSIDVRDFARRGLLRHSGAFTWYWARGGEPSGAMTVAVQVRAALTLSYTHTHHGQAHSVAERVALTHTPCHYGGARPWLLCPRCGGRVARLFMRIGRFACRRCQRVAYATQSVDRMGRLWAKQQKLEARLGDDWQRPKGMRQRIYQRLTAQLWECEAQREDATRHAMARLFGACGLAVG